MSHEKAISMRSSHFLDRDLMPNISVEIHFHNLYYILHLPSALMKVVFLGHEKE